MLVVGGPTNAGLTYCDITKLFGEALKLSSTNHEWKHIVGPG